MIYLKSLLSENVKTPGFIQRLKGYENSKGNRTGGWNRRKKKWFPHTSPEGGTKTIAYGHKLKSNSQFKDGLTDNDAIKLLSQDIDRAISKIKNQLKITQFDSLPLLVQQALVNAVYRGEIKYKHKTAEYMRTNQWDKVADEYLDNKEYNDAGDGVRARMEWNAAQFRAYGQVAGLDKLSADNIRLNDNLVNPNQEVTIRVLDPTKLDNNTVIADIYNLAGQLIKKHRWDNIKKGILQFDAPSNSGTYIIRLNKDLTIRLTVSETE